MGKPSDGKDRLAKRRPSGVSGVASFASVSSHGLDPNVDKFLLLCSDGVWEFVSSQEAVQAVASFDPTEAKRAAEHLASIAWDKWMRELDGQVVDDITALVIHLK